MNAYEEQKLRAAILALKSGDKPAAREMFTRLLQENPQLEEAWVGLSFCVDRVQEQKDCLSRALVLNPQHAYAKTALPRLERNQFPPKIDPAPAEPDQPLGQKKPTSVMRPVYVAIVGTLLCAICAISLMALVNRNQQSIGQISSTSGRMQFVEFYADW